MAKTQTTRMTEEKFLAKMGLPPKTERRKITIVLDAETHFFLSMYASFGRRNRSEIVAKLLEPIAAEMRGLLLKTQNA